MDIDPCYRARRAICNSSFRTLRAEAAKRARTSLYRRWPSKRHLVAYVVVTTLGAEPAPDSGSLRRDLLDVVETLRRGFAGPLGRALPGLVADMAQDPALAQMIR